MQYSNIILLGATFSAPFAQAIIAFTQTPPAVQAGVPALIKWSGSDDSQSTTITLKNGNSDDLQTVNIIDTCKNLKAQQCTWTPSSSLPNGNYALQIQQGNDAPNYSGMIPLTGGSSKAALATTSSASLTSSSKSASVTTTKTTPLAALPLGKSSSSASTTVTKTTPLASLAGGNSTTLAPKNGTAPTTVLLGTGVGTGASSAGTGTALHRNTTMSKATLSSTKSSTTAKSTSSSSSTSSAGASAASPSSTGAPSAAYQIGSPVALILSVFAAVVYLG